MLSQVPLHRARAWYEHDLQYLSFQSKVHRRQHFIISPLLLSSINAQADFAVLFICGLLVGVLEVGCARGELLCMFHNTRSGGRTRGADKFAPRRAEWGLLAHMNTFYDALDAQQRCGRCQERVVVCSIYVLRQYSRLHRKRLFLSCQLVLFPFTNPRPLRPARYTHTYVVGVEYDIYLPLRSNELVSASIHTHSRSRETAFLRRILRAAAPPLLLTMTSGKTRTRMIKSDVPTTCFLRSLLKESRWKIHCRLWECG